jgi:uncharacterized protein
MFKIISYGMGILKKTFIEVCVVMGFFFVLIVVGYFLNKDNVYEEEVEVYAVINNIKVTLEVADDYASKALGLSGREFLDENHGMIFVYEEETPNLTFWMKNTLISLDMIFLNSDFEVVYIIANVPICEKDPCENYTSEADAQYVIELNSGWSEKNDLKVGDSIEVKGLPQFDS